MTVGYNNNSSANGMLSYPTCLNVYQGDVLLILH